jgi:hypothetical protein
MTPLVTLFQRYHRHVAPIDDPAVIRSMAHAWAQQIDLWATMQIKFHNWPYREIEPVVAQVRQALQQES